MRPSRSICLRRGASDNRYAEFASAMKRTSGKRSLKPASISTSRPGLILIFTRAYPSATYPATFSWSASSLFCRPTLTPTGISVLVPPSFADRDTPSLRAAMSQAAISTAAFAMRWPRIHPTGARISSGSPNSRPTTRGRMNWVSTCQAVSVVSYEYPGSSPATHSPHPSSPSPCRVRRRILRFCCPPLLISKYSFKRRGISRSSARSIFMGGSGRRAGSGMSAVRARAHAPRSRGPCSG